ncbi:MAG TPA: hypothetical protein VFA18_13060, partial [Gemmataceae bacterium]|nr:hypothetical protein [Gemmataceae bacterium]
GLALELARKFEGKFPESVREHHCTGCVLDNLACLYLDDAQHRDPRKALEFAQQAVNHQPGNITFKDTLGEAYFRVGRHHEAVPLLLEYAAHGSLVVDDWFLLAMTHWNLGEKAKARCWYRIGREWMAVHEYQTAKQRALRAEAAGLLGISHASAADGEAELLRDLQEMCRNAPVAQPDRFTGSLDQREPCIYALALNNLAWMCVTSADSPLRHPQRAVRLARYATTIMPREGFYVNTLGVARYRAGHWKEAIATLTRSMELEKGALEAFDTFFLAMAHWQLGEKEKARQWYDRAVQWTETHRYQLQGNNEWPEELRRFRAEAAKLLGITTPSKPPAPA